MVSFTKYTERIGVMKLCYQLRCGVAADGVVGRMYLDIKTLFLVLCLYIDAMGLRLNDRDGIKAQSFRF